ncbi:signal transduction histidine kinase [Chitinophaga skermanii]|uniref:histidine kinase n=1 Tax=Chitinophaga skermanii TaxID=331697 RepID=A0A327QAU9_9BACT|nr:HAMP domain-containing sensor histidine kinase [Chitinophaga skermanii]RAJ01659.1 signal transduction histidine kinase [Chitinophaga skermanii]
MKISNKIMLLFSVLTVSIIFLMSFFVYYLANRYSFGDFYKRLEIRAYLTANAAFPPVGTDTLAYNYIRDRQLDKLPSEKEYIIPVEYAAGRIAVPKQLDLPRSFYEEVVRQGRENYRNGERFYAGVLYQHEARKVIVVVSAVNEYRGQYMDELRKILFICFIIAAALIIGAGLIFSHYILRPVHNIMDQVKNISSSNLHLRVEVNDGEDEIGELAATFNNMLDRLETAFETQNNFVSNASHELGTPLTAIIGEADLALRGERDPESYKAAISNMLREAERLNHITRSLLQLAQTGFEGKKQYFDIVRTDELLFSVKKMADRITPGNLVEIDYSLFPEEEEKMAVMGNFQLLELAISNIVNNAVKYSSNQPVSLALAATDTKNIIIIKDMGIGIPERDLPYIFSPFFRASNTDKFKGYGIGLPLTNNIIRMHKGEIIVNSRMNEGTEIQVVLPSANAIKKLG